MGAAAAFSDQTVSAAVLRNTPEADRMGGIRAGYPETAAAEEPAGGIDRLTDRQVRAFIKQSQAGTAPTRKISDGGGLYVMVTPTGSAVWRIKYRIGGKEKVFSAGGFIRRSRSPRRRWHVPTPAS
jgi:hypothetical protein